MNLEQKIKTLSALNAPAGFEDAATRVIPDLLAPSTDSLSVDVMGNIIAYKYKPAINANDDISGNDDKTQTLMLTAHMDEIGLIVTGIRDGFLLFDTLGGIDPRQLSAREVYVLADEPLFGVISVMPPHVLSADEQDKPVAADKLFIDVGLSQESASLRVKLGTPVVFAAEPMNLGDGVICGKALDNRACVAILLEIMERLQNTPLALNLCALITVQEELGTRGASPGAFAVKPDLCVVLDATFAKTPDSPAAKTFSMGGGPTIGVGPNMNRALTKRVFDTAESLEIKCQTEVLHASSGTDAWPIQISREGIRTALVSLPVKYMHSPVEVMSLSDAEAMVNLLVKFLREIAEGIL